VFIRIQSSKDLTVIRIQTPPGIHNGSSNSKILYHKIHAALVPLSLTFYLGGGGNLCRLVNLCKNLTSLDPESGRQIEWGSVIETLLVCTYNISLLLMSRFRITAT
jgi:hypothetical protein